MNSAFSFNKIRFKKYHYTDNRKGASFNYIALMIKGRCKIVSDCGTIKVNEGDFFFIPINLSYQSYWYDNNEIEFLSFGFTKLDTSDNLNFDLQKIGVFKDLAEKASKIPIEGNDVTLKTLGMFCSLFAELIPHMKYADGHKEYNIIKKAKNFILENPDCNMKAVAGHCNISEPYLYIVFKNAEKNHTQ